MCCESSSSSCFFVLPFLITSKLKLVRIFVVDAMPCMIHDLCLQATKDKDNFRSKVDRDQLMLFTQRQYAKKREEEVGMSATDAKAEFEGKLKEQSSEEELEVPQVRFPLC